MTRSVETAPETARAAGADRPRGKSWWRRPWMIPLAVVIAAVLFHIWRRYITFDPRLATVVLPPEFPQKYLLLVGHITFGSIALICVGLQLWPWLRRTRPGVHRMVGRIYVFGAVLPSAALAAVLLTRLDGPGWVGRAALDVLWVLATVTGWRMARQGRYAKHRRFMIYSFALTMDAATTRLLILMIPAFAGPSLNVPLFLEAVAWCGWLFNLVVAHWWIERTRDPRPPRRRPTTTPAETVVVDRSTAMA